MCPQEKRTVYWKCLRIIIIIIIIQYKSYSVYKYPIHSPTHLSVYPFTSVYSSIYPLPQSRALRDKLIVTQQFMKFCDFYGTGRSITEANKGLSLDPVLSQLNSSCSDKKNIHHVHGIHRKFTWFPSECAWYMTGQWMISVIFLVFSCQALVTKPLSG
jgi:hypothetical protein